MSSLKDLVKKAEDNDYVNEHEKALPYLGWFWREPTKHMQISFYQGKLWIDQARKWTYPNTRPFESKQDVREFKEDLKPVLEKIMEQGGILEEDKDKVQEILGEWASEIYKTVRYCGECGYESEDFEEHLESDCSERLSRKNGKLVYSYGDEE